MAGNDMLTEALGLFRRRAGEEQRAYLARPRSRSASQSYHTTSQRTT